MAAGKPMRESTGAGFRQVATPTRTRTPTLTPTPTPTRIPNPHEGRRVEKQLRRLLRQLP